MEKVFVDTSAIYALMVREDGRHENAAAIFGTLAKGRFQLLTSCFVAHETITLLQARIGISAVEAFYRDVVPCLTLVWVDRTLFDRAMEGLLAARSRTISLTDWTSFAIMRSAGITAAFAFDSDFEAQGFKLLTA